MKKSLSWAMSMSLRDWVQYGWLLPESRILNPESCSALSLKRIQHEFATASAWLAVFRRADHVLNQPDISRVDDSETVPSLSEYTTCEMWRCKSSRSSLMDLYS